MKISLLRLLPLILFLVPTFGCGEDRETLNFTATAYSVEGTTASGEETRKGIVAADPQVIPLGSEIRILNAGKYSGDYEVLDTGRKIQGRRIDIYIRNAAEAKRFGRRRVKVQILDRPGEE